MRMPPLVGYLVAGVAIGPFTPGFIADANLASQLAEIGVILLMFGVGLHFSIRGLWAVRHIAMPGALTQVARTASLFCWAASPHPNAQMCCSQPFRRSFSSRRSSSVAAT
jgi:CPA2 family monovalent cation:H+ antiporter-2